MKRQPLEMDEALQAELQRCWQEATPEAHAAVLQCLPAGKSADFYAGMLKGHAMSFADLTTFYGVNHVSGFLFGQLVLEAAVFHLYERAQAIEATAAKVAAPVEDSELREFPLSAETYAAALQRFEASHSRVLVELQPAMLVVLIGAVQMALRHPQFPPYSKRLLIGLMTDLTQQAFATAPEIAAHIEAGWEPRFDVAAANWRN